MRRQTGNETVNHVSEQPSAMSPGRTTSPAMTEEMCVALSLGAQLDGDCRVAALLAMTVGGH
jgi:hypothetical protein